MTKRVYIETTITSYLAAWPSRDLLQAARQQLTRDWWELKREQHELFTSQVVLDEIAGGEAAMANQRVAVMSGIAIRFTSAKTTLVNDRSWP